MDWLNEFDLHKNIVYFSVSVEESGDQLITLEMEYFLENWFHTSETLRWSTSQK